jgi:hypothetical protein
MEVNDTRLQSGYQRSLMAPQGMRGVTYGSKSLDQQPGSQLLLFGTTQDQSCWTALAKIFQTLIFDGGNREQAFKALHSDVRDRGSASNSRETSREAPGGDVPRGACNLPSDAIRLALNEKSALAHATHVSFGLGRVSYSF